MFNRVFNRGGHGKAQISSESPAIQSQAGAATNIRRQASMRVAQFDQADTSTPAEPNFSKMNNKYHSLSSRRFVSCENVRRLPLENNNNDHDIDNEFERRSCQDVIDGEDEDFEYDDDDDKHMKNKFRKHYSSITNILMRSFRKAKSKKKKEATQQQQQQQNNETLEVTNNNSHTLPRVASNTFRSEIVSSTLTKSQAKKIAEKKVEAPVAPKEDLYVHEQDSDEENTGSEEGEEEDAAPVFLGAKIISNEFVDLSPKVDNKTENINNNKRFYSTLPVLKTESLTLPKDFSRVNKPSDLLQKFSSHQKPRAPRPPNTEVTLSRTSKNYEHFSKFKSEEKLDSSKETGLEKPLATVKRSKTFTQQLQDMLKEQKTKLVDEETSSHVNVRLDDQRLGSISRQGSEMNCLMKKDIYQSAKSLSGLRENKNYGSNLDIYSKIIKNSEPKKNSVYETQNKVSEYFNQDLSKDYEVIKKFKY